MNIAFVNELAQLCNRLEIDVWEMIDAASTKPFGFTRFDPGPGMGGHCLPIDSFYLGFKAREHDLYPEFIELAGKVNQAQPGYCVDRVQQGLNAMGRPVIGSRVLILGVSYKAGIGDVRESPALVIIEQLKRLGANVEYHDPHVPELTQMGLRSTAEAKAEGADVAVIVTPHPDFNYEMLLAEAPLVVDLRGVTRHLNASNLVRL